MVSYLFCTQAVKITTSIYFLLQGEIMYAKKKKFIFTAACAMIIMLACGLPGTAAVTEAPATEAPATDTSATEVSAPTSEITSAVQHEVIPVGLPSQQSGQAADFDASNVLTNGSLVGGDRFTFGRFERPFNATTMDVYFSQLDIVDTQVSQDDTWIYGGMLLKGLNNDSSSASQYAVELDTDLDGKGDWLIIAIKPTSTEWTVNGVKVYGDTNNDVGGQLPTLTDKAQVGDGFETLVFDQGKGDDSDSAWVRISPNDPNMVEISIKKSVVGNPLKYLINMWAGTSLLNPALFDLNDHFTHEQAGAADKGLQNYYPIKEVFEIDNSCRMAVGFQPTGNEPGICESLIPVNEQQPLPPGPSGCQATSADISACNQDVYCNWNASSCSCVCKIPG